MIGKYYRAAKQWGPFAARTAFYGTLSVTLGPLTKDHSASLWAMKRWCRASTKGLRIEVIADGIENAPASGPFVYATNHQSIVDIIVLGSVLAGDYKWAAKRSLFKIPFLGWHLALAGHVPVDRGGGARTAANVIKAFEGVLGNGKPLLIFPEGTRSEDGILKDFKAGGFYAAVRAGVPVVPVALDGTHDLMKKGALDTGEDNIRIVRVRVGAPIAPKTTGSAVGTAANASVKEAHRVADLRDRTHAAVTELLRSIGGRIAPDDAPDSGEGGVQPEALG
jgi:1-acyl-sn-glycerol-3-phosphate acyltransferase